MPRVFGSQINLQKIPVLGIVVESSANASPPASPVNGQLWYDTTNNVLNARVNGTWVQVDNTNVLTSSSSAGGDLSGTLSNLQIVANAVGTTEIANSAVTYAKIQNVSATDRLLGRDTAGAGVIEELTATGGLEFTGTGIQTSAFTGDVTKSAGGTALTIANDAVTYAKMQNVTTDRILGRDTAGSGDPEELTVSGGLEFTGGPGIQRSALTGDVTASAGSNTTAIAAGVIVPADLNSTTNLNGIATQNAATADITVSGFKITNLATPVSATDAATKGYVDATLTGLDWKNSVRIGSTANQGGTYTATGGTSARGQFTAMSNAAIDGVTPAAGDRILLKNQSTGAQNGIWVITTLGTGANGVWDRATDFDQDAEVTAGAAVFIEEGTTQDNTSWVLTTNNPIIIGGASGTSLAWAQFNGSGSFIAGNGLTLTGNTFDVVGTTNRISVAADSIDISSSYVGQASITTLGTITTGTWNGTDIATADGGTGISTNPTQGGIAYGASTSAFGWSAAGTTGQILHSGGTGAPTWAAVNLASGTEVTGTLGLGNGGTGGTTAASARTSLGATGKFASTLGALSAGVETTITHSLGTSDVHTQFRDASTNFEIEFNWRVVDTNTVGVTADIAYGASAVRCVVIG